MNKALILLAFPLAFSASCATKRYPMAISLSPEEISLMDCKDLQLEEARIQQTEAQIEDIAGTDWRSIAGFLGDYGIGNAMAKSEAKKALRDRAQSVRTTKVQRGCNGQSVAAASAREAPTADGGKLKLAYYDAKAVGVIMSSGEIRSFQNRQAIALPRGTRGEDYLQPAIKDGRNIGVLTPDGTLVLFEGEESLGATVSAN